MDDREIGILAEQLFFVGFDLHLLLLLVVSGVQPFACSSRFSFNYSREGTALEDFYTNLAANN